MRLEVRGAELRFGRRVVFENLDATFEADRVTALIGPSGSGKSSLLAVMAGHLRLNAGEVFGVDADGTRHELTADLVAWVPQGMNALGARTALENVMIGPLAAGCGHDEARRRSLDALEAVGVAELSGKIARQLSGGELQRVSFARALASDKPLIFADEPSSSLDARNTARIAELLYHLRQQATIVVATHDPLLIEAAEAQVHLRQESLHAA
jgi:ABC-type lipoprotein export system ATPase subunit